MTFTGYAGVLIATLAAAYLTGWRRGLFLPVARSAGIVMAALCVVQLVGGQRWGELELLLVADRRPDGSRRGAAPRRAAGRAADGGRVPGRCGAPGPAGAAARSGHRRAAAHAVLRRRDGARLRAGRHRAQGDVAGGRSFPDWPRCSC